ncbi:MAG: hypothetical protein SGPRY_009896, partial [Prymnesium sp.]
MVERRAREMYRQLLSYTPKLEAVCEQLRSNEYDLAVSLADKVHREISESSQK